MDKLFTNPESLEDNFENEFRKDMDRLHFNMDCGKCFEMKYPNIPFNTSDKVSNILKSETDIYLLSSALYSSFRKITHWDQDNLLSDQNKKWFIRVLKRLNEITI